MVQHGRSFFNKMTKYMVREIRVKSKVKLGGCIYLYFEDVNAEPVVFHWKYILADIDVSKESSADTLLPQKTN